MKKKYLSLAASAAVASAIFVGCGGNNITDLTIGGGAVDGYIQGADVSCVRAADGLVVFNETNATDDTGAFEYKGPHIGDVICTVTGGTETDSGVAFEGTMKKYFNTETIDGKIIVSPLSTIVAAKVKAAKDAGTPITEAAAKTQTATALGLSEAMLDADPIALLESSSANSAEAIASASALQIIKVVQKMAETAAKATSTNPAEQKLVMEAVYESLADQLTGTTEIDIQDKAETVVENAATKAAEKIGGDTAAKDLIKAIAAAVSPPIFSDALVAASLTTFFAILLTEVFVPVN